MSDHEGRTRPIRRTGLADLLVVATSDWFARISRRSVTARTADGLQRTPSSRRAGEDSGARLWPVRRPRADPRSERRLCLHARHVTILPRQDTSYQGGGSLDPNRGHFCRETWSNQSRSSRSRDHRQPESVLNDRASPDRCVRGQGELANKISASRKVFSIDRYCADRRR